MTTHWKTEKEKPLKHDVSYNYMCDLLLISAWSLHNKQHIIKQRVRLTFNFILVQLQSFLPTSTRAPSFITGYKHQMVIPSTTITKTPCCHTRRQASNLVFYFTDCPSFNSSTSSSLSQGQTIPFLVTIIISSKQLLSLPSQWSTSCFTTKRWSNEFIICDVNGLAKIK